MKIAIVGTGKIVKEVLPVLLENERIEVTAICSRPQSRDKAEDLAAQYAIAHVYTDYAQLLKEGGFDFVYIGIVNSEHYAYTRQALLAGRHVIVEKPFCLSLAEARELADLAVQKHRYLFEAVTILHTPQFQALRDLLPRLGAVRLVQCNYSQYSSRYDRYLQGDVAPAFSPELGGGALMDLNVYNIDFVTALFGRPASVSYTCRRGFNGIDTSGTVVLGYSQMTAVCTAAKDSASPGIGIVQGERGWLRVIGAPNDFQGFEFVADGEQGKSVSEATEHRMAPEFRHFERMFRSGDYAAMRHYLDLSLVEAEVLERARLSAKQHS